MSNTIKFVFSLLTFCLITACGAGGGQQQGKASPDYKEVKSMVIDILKTDEGKRAVQETVKKESMSLDGVKIQSSVEKALTDPKNQEGFKEMMKDPKVAAAFAKAIQDEHKKLLKEMMKDPEYQQLLIKTLKDPKAQENLLHVMNTPSYKQQTMSVMKDAMQSPMFRLEMINLMVEAQKEMMKPEKKENGKGGNKSSGAGGSGGAGGGGGAGQ